MNEMPDIKIPDKTEYQLAQAMEETLSHPNYHIEIKWSRRPVLEARHKYTLPTTTHDALGRVQRFGVEAFTIIYHPDHIHLSIWKDWLNTAVDFDYRYETPGDLEKLIRQVKNAQELPL